MLYKNTFLNLISDLEDLYAMKQRKSKYYIPRNSLMYNMGKELSRKFFLSQFV